MRFGACPRKDMLSVAIAIDMPADTGTAAPIISKSCEAAVGTGRCPLARDLKASSVVTWYAVVHSEDPEGARLRIELRDRSATGVLVETRDLVFSAHDKSESRWASAGAVIAALVAARDSPDTAPAIAHRMVVPVGHAFGDEGLPWGFDLVFVTGPGLDRGGYRLGGFVRGFVGLPRAPAVIGMLSLGYAQRPGDLDLSWLSASGGMGARIGRRESTVSAELIGELVVERMSMTGRNAATGHEASVSQNRFGGRLGTNFALRVWADFAFVLGAEVSALRPSIDIAFLDERVGRAPLVEFGMSGGVRFSH